MLIRNWADNHDFIATRIHHPTTVEEARKFIAAEPKIHAVGARHSFDGAADSPGALIDLSNIPTEITIDSEQKTVTTGAATTYTTLARALQAAGWALHNMASLPHITVSGAVATGTHGSGDRLGSLATAVDALEMIAPSGDLITTQRGAPDFDGMVVALGAIGVVTRLTLDIEPTYTIRQDAFEHLPWSALLNDLDAVMGAGDSVSLFTLWSRETIGRLWIKTRDAHAASPPRGARPAVHPSASGTAESLLRLTEFGTAGPWSERLPHIRPEFEPTPSEQIQSEYILPRAQATTAMSRLRTIGDRIDRHLIITEIRSMAGDTLWLSPAYRQDSIAIHFTWKKHPQEVEALTQEIENLLRPLGSRPHWGKRMHSTAQHLAKLYGKWEQFHSLAQSCDPNGKFRNAYLDTHIFG